MTVLDWSFLPLCKSQQFFYFKQAFSGLDEGISKRAKLLGNTALDAALNAQFFVQIGIFTAVPMIMGFILELGLLKVWILSGVIFIYNVGFCHFVLLKLVFLVFCFAFTCTILQAVFSFITMQLQFCSVFFTFSLGTRTHYFGRTILHGGAKVCRSYELHSEGSYNRHRK